MLRALRYTKQAEDDLLLIHSYIAQYSPRAAERFVTHLHETCVHLSEMPGMGVRRDELRQGLRQWVVSDYLILYRIDDTGIQVVRLVHGRRDLTKLVSER